MNLIDWRDLPRQKNRDQGRRNSAPRFLTLHYNGPAIPQQKTLQQWREHLAFIANFHIGPYLNADGIQYHYAVLPGGEVVQTRDDTAILWHCGNATGNAESLAIHFPLGGSQRPNAAQWSAADELMEQLRSRYSIATNSVFGHRQWPRRRGMANINNGQMPEQSACPGDAIMALLAEWRTERSGRYTVRVQTPVREAPDMAARIAWNGTCILEAGRIIEGGTLVQGKPVQGDTRWIHWPAAGFIHYSAVA